MLGALSAADNSADRRCWKQPTYHPQALGMSDAPPFDNCEKTMKEKRDYYESDGLEVFDVIEAFDLNFNLGNVCKYICRAGRKTFDPLPDLRKACTYLEREIERLESDSYDE